jgi:SNF family Na+-dependent transporter
MWTIIYLCLWKGIRLTSRVAVFTALFPYLPMLALFIRGMTLEGAWDGLKYYLIPDAQRLLNKKAWIQAAGKQKKKEFGLRKFSLLSGHVLWAYGIGWGIIPALSSYNRPDYNFYRDIVVTGSTSILTNVFSGFVVFPVLGFMSHKANVSIEQVVSSGPGLAFIVYPKAVSLMPFPHFWAITFFFMIFLLGIDSQFVTCESGMIED